MIMFFDSPILFGFFVSVRKINMKDIAKDISSIFQQSLLYVTCKFNFFSFFESDICLKLNAVIFTCLFYSQRNYCW